ncbi:hypothetical protein PR048_003255 [Dryococelus australis]|uniref:Uncharacterized protein n=1 Tax=Dryococelus australis TaxID=614101 RepID=A0ABQ9IMJ6_9NEOP|nr:hypothetical protein PR048_003255 [Dryococelus australis]
MCLALQSTKERPQVRHLWEATVKSVTLHMRKVIGEQILTFENTLNFRQLCPISMDPSEFDVLTPGDFLIGAPFNGIPKQDLSHIVENTLD